MSSPIVNPMGSAAFVGTAGTFEYDSLLSDGHNVTSVVSPFDFAGHPPGASGPILKRGTVIHFVAAAAGNLAWLPAAAAECNAVLAQDVDVSIVPTPPVQLYLTGKMKASAMTYLAGVDPPAAVDNLRKNGIWVETVLNQAGTMTRAPGNVPPIFGGQAAPPSDAAKKALEDATKALADDIQRENAHEPRPVPIVDPHVTHDPLAHRTGPLPNDPTITHGGLPHKDQPHPHTPAVEHKGEDPHKGEHHK
jgi:hypothetical protein